MSLDTSLKYVLYICIHVCTCSQHIARERLQKLVEPAYFTRL